MNHDPKLVEAIYYFVSERTGVSKSKLKPTTDLVRHLGVGGDDGDDILHEYSEAFEVDVSQIDCGLLFGGEGISPFWPLEALVALLRWAFWSSPRQTRD